ncbi:SPOR domain-containing protein [Sphingorhabdus sp.]|uniref:SPOR domain-containing protein n=1 Tax=Sphingorhabdus sp. TaxID=1902408 RepID=UPI0035B29BBE|nr:SPOR domain-containing protein [Sphingomonadaceae bacterium]
MRTLSLHPFAIAVCLAVAAQPAFADVKAGVDAWSNGDFDGAVKEWREPARKGDADAQFNLGQAYKLGRGVKQDFNLAADWYQRAAKQGHLQAADSLGHLYHYQGKVKEALPYLETSAARGEPRAQYLLATELFNGVNAAKNWVRAYALMTRASASGLAPASRSLAEMDKYIPLEQRQQGVVLAGEIEKSSAQVRAAQIAGFPINTKAPVAVAQKVDVPASQPAATADDQPAGFPGTIPPIAGEQSPEPTKAPAKAHPRTAAPVSGKWRIQLGAFGSEANANKLWASLKSRVSGLSGSSHYLVPAGNVSRLQAGPFASRADADAMCSKVKAAAVGQGCLVVAP